MARDNDVTNGRMAEMTPPTEAAAEVMGAQMTHNSSAVMALVRYAQSDAKV